MEYLVIIVIVLQIVAIYLVWRSNSKSSGISDNSGLLNQINQTNLNLLGQISDKINSFSLNQLEQNNNNFQALEKRFGQLELQLQDRLNSELGKIQQLQLSSEQNLSNKFEKQLSDQRIEFSLVRENNQKGLQELQEKVRIQLSNSIQSLVDLNKTELSSLRESNQKNIELLSRSNQERLKEMEDHIKSRLDENFQQNRKSFEDVAKNLGSMQSTAEKMIESTKSVEKLNSIFDRTSSKAFGNFSENYLETLLTEHLYPDQWQKQVAIPDSSDKIDFVVQFGDKKIGIDSKFPLTKFQDYIEADTADKNKTRKEYLQSVLLMAKDVSKKYDKGHLDLLLIYLPSETMYAEAVGDDKLMEELQKIKVNLTSPSLFFPFISLVQTYRFKYEVNQRAEEIITGLKRLKKNILSFQNEFDKLGDKLRHAQQNYDQSQKSLGNVQTEIFKLEAPVSTPLIMEDSSNLIPADETNSLL
jgi:DNA anti-recombination protein RmuC